MRLTSNCVLDDTFLYRSWGDQHSSGGRRAPVTHRRCHSRIHCRLACKLVYRRLAEYVIHLLARGEFSIIIVNLAIAGGLMSVLQPFAALYVLILASASPLLAKESERIHGLFVKLLSRLRRKKKADAEVEDLQL